jgi:site-specific recombinase XerC
MEGSQGFSGFTPNSRLGEGGKLQDAIETYLYYHYIEGSTPQTIEAYRRELRSFAVRTGDVQLADITTMSIMGMLSDMKARELAHRSIKNRLAVVSTFLKWAVLWEPLETNPAAKLKPPRIPRLASLSYPVSSSNPS